MPGKQLANVDTAWLRMEDPTNLMMITGLMIFDAPIDYERLRNTLEHSLLRYSRFRQRVAMPRFSLDRPTWEEDPHFDWNYHLTRFKLGPHAGRKDLENKVNELMSTQLDFSRPLWQFTLIENYGNGAAVISRLHHCIADGVALMQVLLSMTSDSPDALLPELPPDKPVYHSRNGLEELFPPVSQALNITSRITGMLIHESMESLIKPRHAIDLAKLYTKGVEALGRLVLRLPDPQTLFKGPLGKEKNAAWSMPVPLKDVKYIGKVLGGTVNDILLTAVTGALKRYMEKRGASTQGINFRAVVPVNLRPLETGYQLGNQFGLVFLSLPIYIEDPRQRLQELKRRMDDIKNTPEALVAFGILNTIGMTPKEIENIVVYIFGTKGTGVMTNVPGPQKQLYMAGAPVNTVMAWVPQSGHLGLGVSIISYNHKVWLGIATDMGLVPDPESIVGYFESEFNDLLCLAKRIDAGLSCPAVPVISMLDDMLVKLDEMIANAKTTGEEATPVIQPEAAISQKTNAPRKEYCQGTRKDGKPCMNSALPGEKYCRVHLKADTARVIEKEPIGEPHAMKGGEAAIGSAEAILMEAFSKPNETTPEVVFTLPERKARHNGKGKKHKAQPADES
ncbi:MAG: WS/DGAT/MGAT family O-acyltransferase [Omnitrophica WOR_2 bacterium]